MRTTDDMSDKIFDQKCRSEGTDPFQPPLELIFRTSTTCAIGNHFVSRFSDSPEEFGALDASRAVEAAFRLSG
jgi:hypothetical protein